MKYKNITNSRGYVLIHHQYFGNEINMVNKRLSAPLSIAAAGSESGKKAAVCALRCGAGTPLTLGMAHVPSTRTGNSCC
ncbi:MAG: hypothetical protein KGQ37_02630 [Hyphomicrobiales bacterium]|nr:hypothetical protein [Hyphomicrobiales bacterium]